MAFTTEGFHHVTMVSRDAQRTVSFYRDVLGLRLVKKTVNFDVPNTYHLYFGDDTGSPGSILTFFEWPDAVRGRYGVGGIHHIALKTANDDTLLKWKRRLTDHDVPVSGPYNRGWFHSIYFRDPDGQVLEIATEGPGYDLDEPIGALGQQLKMPPEGQLRGHRDEKAIAAQTWEEPVPEITPDMELRIIHHVTGFTDDLVRANEFYDQALGMRLIKQSVNQDDPDTLHHFWANYDGTRIAPASSMTLFGWPETAPRASEGIGQTHHIAFRAPGDDDQEAWRTYLLGLGYEVSPVMDRKYFKSIYFRTHDGLLVEIATDGPGFAVDEDPGALGGGVMLPPWLESQRDEIIAGLRPLT
ncbi:MAG TPA: VOC family protein [Thermomicrobiales bacterium]|nr:VOC family protein [Thermomicrobiales bacterium]